MVNRCQDDRNLPLEVGEHSYQKPLRVSFTGQVGASLLRNLMV